MKNRIRIVISVVILMAVVAVVLTRRGGPTDGSIVASGTVEATEADLGFQLPGRVLQISPREGDVVSAGQELARLDAAEYEAGRNAAAAQLAANEARLAELRSGARPEEKAQAQAAVRAAEPRAEDARLDEARTRNLFAGGAVSQQTLDRAVTALAGAESSLDQARQTLAMVLEGPRVETVRAQEAMVDQARAGLARADATLANAVIVAPFPGRITVRHREPGEVVGPGAPVLTLLDPGNRWVRIYVREDQIGAIRVGMAARITSDTYPDKVYQGEVTFIGSEAEFTPRNVQTTEERIKLVYPVKVQIIGDTEFELKPGIPADVSLGGTGA